MASNALKILALMGVACTLSACHTIDGDRIPLTAVNIVFSDAGMWNTYGVGGALDTQRFIKSEKVPGNFPYTASTYTGYGGVLLVCGYTGDVYAFDLSCPVECKTTVRVQVDNEAKVAECPKCHSTFSIFDGLGYPLSGTAANNGYRLRYYVVGSGSTDYRVITR